MNRRTALSAIGIAGLCPTAVMAIPEKKEQENPDGLPVVELYGEGQYVKASILSELLPKAEKVIDFDNHALFRIKIWVNKKDSVPPTRLKDFTFIGCALEIELHKNHKCYGNMILYIRTLSGMLYNYWFAADGFTTNITL